MIILAHRGYWKDKSEKDTTIAFKRSLRIIINLELQLINGKIIDQTVG